MIYLTHMNEKIKQIKQIKSAFDRLPWRLKVLFLPVLSLFITPGDSYQKFINLTYPVAYASAKSPDEVAEEILHQVQEKYNENEIYTSIRPKPRPNRIHPDHTQIEKSIRPKPRPDVPAIILHEVQKNFNKHGK